jgi:phosphoglycerate dehydrogenase-like enzyme
VKVVLTSAEGEAHFDAVLRDLPIPDLEIVKALDRAAALREAADADVIYGLVSPELIAAAPKLRWFQASSAGVEAAARMPELIERDIILTNTRGAHGPSIGEHVFALLFSLTRFMPACWERQKTHRWERGDLYRAAREINGGTMGLIGYGAIGRATAKRAAGFGMKVVAVDAQPAPPDAHVAEVWPTSRIDELLRQSDVVVVTAPLTAETHHLLDAERLAQMRPDAYLIVVSRGGIVDEDALAAALREGRIAGTGIDVAETEPLPADSPLWDAPNLVITPHMAGASSDKERRCVEILRDNLIRYVNGEPLLNEVDRARGY